MDLKVSYELDKLKDIVEERTRLIDELSMEPSKSDTISLKSQLSTVLDLLNSVGGHGTDEIKAYIDEYNKVLAQLGDDTAVDVGLYTFSPKQDIASKPGESRANAGDIDEDEIEDDETRKRVRFNDDLETFPNEDTEQDAPASAAMTFQPYHDYEEDTTNSSSSTSDKRVNAGHMISNDELFARQQQQLLEQDTHLDSLATTIKNTHGISIDINQELTDQNEHILDDMENLLDTSSRNLERARRRLDSFQRTARENGPCSIIVMLTIILIFLLIIL